MFELSSVIAITVICYLAGVVAKNIGTIDKWIPSICGALGGVLGALGMLIMPDYPAGDFLTAIAVGIVSGLAATGTNQIIKQLGKGE